MEVLFLINKMVKGLSAITSSSQEVIQDILVMDFTIVTASLVGNPSNKDKHWVLVDTGLEDRKSVV